MNERRNATIAGIYYVAVATVFGALCLLAMAPAPPRLIASWLLRADAPGVLEAAAISAVAIFLLGAYVLLRRRFSAIEGAVGAVIAVLAMWYGVPFMLLLILPIFMVRPHEKRASDA